MQNGATDFAGILRSMKAEPVEEAPEKAPAARSEQELEQTRRKPRHCSMPSRNSRPTKESVRTKQNLETLKPGCRPRCRQHARAAGQGCFTALDAGATAPAIEEAMAVIKPQAAEAPTPSAETLQPAQADEEELDAELLAIFIEEAKGSTGSDRQQCRPAPRPAAQRRSDDQHPALVPTLKGSGVHGRPARSR